MLCQHQAPKIPLKLSFCEIIGHMIERERTNLARYEKTKCHKVKKVKVTMKLVRNLTQVLLYYTFTLALFYL